MENYRVLFFGTWGYGRAGLEGLLNCSNVEIVKVFTKWNPGKPDVYMDQVKTLAEAYVLPVMNTFKSECADSEFEECVMAFQDIDFIISCCYDRIFSSSVLEVAGLGALNIHPSLLPKYRGVKPLENAMINGEKETGVTIHKLTQILDGGHIVLQKDGIEITPEKNYKQLYKEQCDAIINGTMTFFGSPMEHLVNAFPQDESEVSWAPRLKLQFKNWMSVKLISLFHLGEWGSEHLGKF